MTNYEKIKAMTLEEMAEEICNTHKDCYECEFDKDCDFECDGVTKWLKSEASTERVFTNADKIRQMSDSELTEELYRLMGNAAKCPDCFWKSGRERLELYLKLGSK